MLGGFKSSQAPKLFLRNAAAAPPCPPVQAHREVLDEASLPSRAEIGLPEGKVIYSCANQVG